jgi:hypothetical protein
MNRWWWKDGCGCIGERIGWSCGIVWGRGEQVSSCNGRKTQSDGDGLMQWTQIEKGPSIPTGLVVLIRFWPENGFGSMNIREMSESHIIRFSICRGVVPGTVIIRLPNICRESPIRCKPTLISVSSVSLPLRSEQFAISACVAPRDCRLCGGSKVAWPTTWPRGSQQTINRTHPNSNIPPNNLGPICIRASPHPIFEIEGHPLQHELNHICRRQADASIHTAA